MKVIFLIFSVLFFIYIVWPGPGKISDFSPLPNSVKSKLDGDNWQVPNVTAYFSDHYRKFVVDFYSKDYQRLTHLPFPPLRLNYPPEYSWIAIKKHTDTTYLEELIYPLKDSIFVNGFEPFYADGQSRFWGATKFEADGQHFYTKATLRFYPSHTLVRIPVYFGIILSIILLNKLGKKIIFEK